jgi:type VI secretion system protein ImpL
MLRSSFRIVLSLIFAAIVWWIGPMIAIGRYHPFGWLWLRQLLVVLLLFWGFYPLLRWLLGKFLSLFTRRKHKAPPSNNDRISSRLADLELTLRKIWVDRQKGFFRRLTYRMRKGHLREQPWFMLLGSSGSGKTSLLNHTGQNALPGEVAGLPRLGESLGQTEDCGFWVNDRAVWIDSSGQWAEREALGESGFSAWKKLLSGVRRMRGSAGLDGLVLCVDLDWMLKASSEQRKRLADTLRGRVLELADWFDAELPVYIVLTHVDTLPGGGAMLAALEDETLAGGMGFEALPEGDVDGWYERFEHRVQRVVQFIIPQMADAGESQQLLHFTESLGRLRSPLLEFVKSVSMHASSIRGGQLRGMWFGTSVYLMATDEAANLVQLDEPNESPAFRSFAKTFFAPIGQAIEERNILRFGDKSLASRGKRMLRWGGSVLALCLLSVWLVLTYFDQRSYIDQIWAQFGEGKRLAQELADTPSADIALMDVSGQMRYAGSQLGRGFSMIPSTFFEHSRIRNVANETYRRHLFKSFVPEMFKYVTVQLKSEMEGGTGDVYETLRLYLMLVKPERRDPDVAVRWFEKRWERIAPANSSEEEKSVFLGHVAAAFSPPLLPATPVDEGLLNQARAVASGLPSAIRVIDKIREQGLPESVEDVSLSRAGGLNAPMLLRMRSDTPTTSPIISGWYTRAGYHDVFMPRLMKSARIIFEEENWVLRDETGAKGNAFDVEKTVQDMADAARRQFLQDYIQEWRSFINDVTVRRFSSMDDAAWLAKAMMDPQSALAQLIRFIGRETSLTGNYEGDVDSWIDRQKLNLERTRRAVVGEISGQHYRYRVLPEHVVDEYFNSLRRMAVSLMPNSGVESAASPLSRLFEPLYRQISLVNGAMQVGQLMPEYDSFRRMRAGAARQPEPIRGIMLDLIDSGSNATAQKSSVELTKGATGASKSICPQTVARYPLVRSSSQDVGSEDFRRLFGPRGVMDSYFNDELAQYVDTSNLPWRARKVDGMAGSLVNPNIIRSYELARSIRDNFFNENGQLGFSVIVRAVDMDASVSEALIDIGGEQLRYAHGASAPKKIDWSPQRSTMVVRLHMRSVDGRTQQMEFTGPWAIFRFFDAGDPLTLADDKRVLRFKTALGAISLEFQATSSDFPLWSRTLSQFYCPSK